MARKIRIKWATSRYRVGRDDAIRIRIEVTCAEGMSEKIFAYRMLPKNPQTGSKRGYFSHICSPADLEDFPESAPIPTHVPPWFRLSYVDVLVRSETESAAFLNDVRSDIRRLIASLETIDTIFPAGEDDFLTGLVCPTSSSSSASSEYSLPSLSSESLGPLKSIKSTGSLEQSIGFGRPWLAYGLGAGSPIGSSDSLDALNRNQSYVDLQCGLVSQQLLIQGYDFADLPADAVVYGYTARLILRDGSLVGSSLSATSESSESSSASAAAIIAPILTYFRLYDPTKGFVGTDRGNNRPILGPDWQKFTFGGASDLWGTTIPVNVLRNRGDFGVGLVVYLPAEIMQARVDVDGVELEIHYR